MNRAVLLTRCAEPIIPPSRRRRSGPTGLYLAVAAAMALAVGACTGGDPTSTPTPADTEPHATAPKSTPSPAPTALSADEAEAHAVAAVEEYLTLFDEISADPSRDVTALEQVANGRALDFATHQVTTWRDEGYTAVGAQVASDFAVTSVDIDPDSSAADYPTVALTACVDLGDTDLVDADGASVVPADRPDRVLVDYVVANVGWPDDQQWRVVRDDDQITDSDPPEFAPCP
jgi:hypothetical protein